MSSRDVKVREKERKFLRKTIGQHYIALENHSNTLYRASEVVHEKKLHSDWFTERSECCNMTPIISTAY